MALVEELTAAAERCLEDVEATGDLKRVIELGASEPGVKCEELLARLKALLDPSSSRGQALLELVGWDLPVSLVPYLEISKTCRELTQEIIHSLAASCSPREILTTLLEALHVYDVRENLELFIVLLQAISSVLPRIQRRRPEFAKETVVGLLSAALATGDDEGCQHEILEELFKLCESLQSMYELEKALDQKELLRKTLVGFILVLLSMVATTEAPTGSSLFSRLLESVRSFGLTPSELLDPTITSTTPVLNSEDVSSELCSAADCGAAFAASILLSEDGSSSSNQLFLSAATSSSSSSSTITCFDALNKARSLFMFVFSRSGSWSSATRGLELIRTVLAASPREAFVIDDDQATSGDMFSLLQILQEMVIRSPSPALRKSTYDTLLSILKRISAGAKFLCLLALISNEATHPAMVSLLLTFAKDEINSCWPPGGRDSNPFTSSEALELVETILHPKQGGPPKLPDNLDAVAGALNLYRFLLLREKSGGTNYTGIRSRDELLKAKSEWLIPLGTVVSAMGIHPESPELDLGVESLQMIRCRCLELVEAELESSN